MKYFLVYLKIVKNVKLIVVLFNTSPPVLSTNTSSPESPANKINKLMLN